MTRTDALEKIQACLNKLHDDGEAAAILKNLRLDHPAFATYIEEVDNSLVEALIKELQDGKPIQYITGLSYFYDRLLHVDDSVLIPRSETEQLVHLAMQQAREINAKTMIDIGTGSGCIPVIFNALMGGGIRVDAVEYSETALNIAQKNADRHDCEINFIAQDFLDESNWTALDKYDLILSNPPYIDPSESVLMPVSVKGYEPQIALFTNDHQALEFYIKIKAFAKNHLNKGGRMIMELNEFRAEETRAIFEEEYQASLIQDLQGKTRLLLVSEK